MTAPCGQSSLERSPSRSSTALLPIGATDGRGRLPHPLAAGLVYATVFVVGSGDGGQTSAAGHGHQTVEPAPKHAGHGFTDSRLVFVWIGLSALLGTQVWDVVRRYEQHKIVPRLAEGSDQAAKR